MRTLSSGGLSRDNHIILSIPLSSSMCEDVWYWKKKASGFYSVKSSYQYLQYLRGDLNVQLEYDLWKQLWKLKVPSKVIYFAWCALSRCLTTRTQSR
ncbi:hypothetical protein G4B88_011153 [Cannabis sativa]|uniref:Reverse transcriptase zinc-binding domain-containing protein n=1 Tax=Cannabis sativa TaxID=3483 RepID=A0A7J6G390_CANSA|nr:hypothetical protein G4B88_011153 [Cannabis sativa]